MSWHDDSAVHGRENSGTWSNHNKDLTLTVLAARCGVTPSTIRRYERFGLVSPRGDASSPRYAEGDIERVLRIRRLTAELGVNLAGAEVVLHMREQILLLRRELETLLQDREHR